MQYMGGKFRFASQITKILERARKPNQLYIEPFVGGGSVLGKMSGMRFAYDASKELISLWQAIQDGWIPPTHVTRERYYEVRDDPTVPDYLRAFVAFGCSYCGRFWGGYRETRSGANIALVSSRSLVKAFDVIQGVHFEHSLYQDLEPKDALVYCDPPYRTAYRKYENAPPFDYDEFWEIMVSWSKTNTVLVSEYDSPVGEVVWEKEYKTGLKARHALPRKEKLFLI